MPSRGVPLHVGCRAHTLPAPPCAPLQPPNGPSPPPMSLSSVQQPEPSFKKHSQILWPSCLLSPTAPVVLRNYCRTSLPEAPRPSTPLTLTPFSHASCLHSGLLAPPASRPWHLLVPGPGTSPPSRTSRDRPLPTEISARMSAAQPGLTGQPV